MKNHFKCPFLFCRTLSVLVLSLLPCQLFSQQIQFENINEAFEFEADNIISLYQDRKGFLWVGTWDGLFKFDGFQFTHYQKFRQENKTSITGFIHDITEDKTGDLWLSTQNGLIHFDPATEHFHQYLRNPGDPASLSNNFVGSTCEDSEGNLWAGPRLVLEKLDRETGQFKHYPIPINPADFPERSFDLASITAYGDYLYFSPKGAGIWRFHKRTEQFERVKSLRESENEIREFRIDNKGNLLVIDGRVSIYDPQQDLFVPVLSTYELPLEIYISTLLCRRSGGYIAGTLERGIIEYDEAFRETGRWYLDQGEHLQDNNHVITLLEGAGGEIWIGTQYVGLRKYDPAQKQFRIYQHRSDDENSLADNNIRDIIETADGNIWLATKTAGISIFDPVRQRFSQLRPQPDNPNSPTAEAVRKLFQDRYGRMWIGSWGYGVDVWNRKTGQLFKFRHQPNQPASLNSNFITSFCETRDGYLWVGTIVGVSVIHLDSLSTGHFRNYRITKSSQDVAPLRITKVYCDHAGRVWAGTELGGVQLYQPDSGSFRRFTDDQGDTATLSYNSVQTIFEDRKNRLWVGADGLNQYLPAQQKFTFEQYEGLVEGGIVGAAEDARGILWLGTYSGICKFHPEQMTVKKYNIKDGLPDDQFLSILAKPGSYDGAIYAGTKNGLVVFHPDSIRENPFIPPVYFTSFEKYRTVGSETLVENISGMPDRDRIHLTHQENTFTVVFTALNYRNSLQNQFAYKMEGLGNNWIDLGNKRELTFSNLSPGTYTLNIKAANNDGRWNEAGRALEIYIAPPWWQTWWAFLLYFLVLGAAAYGFYKFQLNRRMEHAEAERLKELDALKTRLYTNITHEFRTPLTVIMGMTGQLAGGSWLSSVSNEDQKMLQKNLTLIQRNSKNLLRLINQLLDLSKLDSGTMKTDLVQSDIINYLQYLTESFYSMAHEKKIRLMFYSELPELVMDYDEVKIQHIIYNLLSNAIKFTAANGKIVLHVTLSQPESQPFLQIKVQDTGKGISQDQLVHIFDRFYQADNSHTRKDGGTGVGLALTKELTELMEGRITVKSEQGVGTTFTLLLPVRQRKGTPHQPAASQTSRSLVPELTPDLTVAHTGESRLPSPLAQGEEDAPQKPLVLLIEDNPDVTIYIRQLLENDYNIETAPDGQTGIDRALDLTPDLIISDVMMPEKDGYEVCKTLKNDERTSHIPIVLLTAKATEDDKIEGLKTGADAYLNKPFNKEELFVRLANLLQLRKDLQARYSLLIASSDDVRTRPSDDLTIEDLFLQKLQKAIIAHLNDSDLSVDQLARAVNLSQSQLYRKMKALTNETPNAFIRKIRLYRAMEMLQTTDLNISEIAYEVGFNDPNYFSRAFHKEFGKSPKFYRK